MTAAEADRLALLIQARWPHPEFTPVDLVVWRRDLAPYPYRLAEEALDRLVREGRERQPRAPQLLAEVGRLREAQEGRTTELGPAARAAEAAAIAAATPPPGWVPAGARGPLAELVGRVAPAPVDVTRDH
jgi:hypothetical protein